jgi:hypothetical protein
MADLPTCPKCQAEMARGFIPDHSYGASVVGEWYEGEPSKAFFAGIKVPLHRGFPIAAFRCVKCRYLELYADKQFGAK